MKKTKNNKAIFVNNIVNRLISLSLATIMPLSAAGCSQKKDSYDENINQGTIYYDLDEYYLKNSKEYYEHESSELNSIIDEIKDIKYVSNYDEFDNYNIYEKPSLELAEILNDSYSFKNEDYPINYDWYNNGVIDEDLLCKRICDNNTKAGVENKKEVLEIIELIPSVMTKNVNLIKNKSSEFKFNIAFYNLNNLVVDITRQDDCAALYINDDNKILVNYDYTKNYTSMKNTISHECFHLLLNKCINCIPYFHNGCALDASFTDESPLIHTFLTELVTDDFSYEAFGETPDDLYYEERSKLKLICEATDKNINYFKNAVLTSNSMSIMEAFEPEFRNINYAYSIFNAIDKYCYYGYFDVNWDYELFRAASLNYARLGLLKNYYVKIIKQVKTNKITKDEGNRKIAEIKKSFSITDLSSSIDDNYLECMDELDSIYEKNFSKIK